MILKKVLISIFLFLVVAVVAIPFLPDAEAIEPETYPRNLRVLELRYFPAGNDYVYNPATLSAELQTMLEDGSSFQKYKGLNNTSSLNVEIVDTIDVQGARPNPDGSWESSFHQILSDNNICQIIHDEDIDQVWEWVDTRPGYDNAPGMEYIISSNYFKNPVQPVVIPTDRGCGGQDSFVFLSFDYSRASDQALHSYGHYIEGLLGNLQGENLFWKRYGGDSTVEFSRALRCGNVHFPPNGTTDYDYTNTTVVDNSCRDWNPDANGQTTQIDCSEWGCNQEGYLKWWMQNMPNEGNTFTYSGKTIPNWWDFQVDMDDIIPAYIANGTFYLNQTFLDQNELPLDPPSQVGQVSTAKQNSGTSISWNHTVSGEDRILVVSASYRAASNPNAQISTLTYGGQNMTFIRRDAHTHRSTEMWYLVNPPVGSTSVSATWTADPENQVLAATTLTGIKQTNSIVTHVGAGSNTGSSGTLSITVPSSDREVVLGVLSTYPNGNNNLASVINDTAEIWNTRTSQNHIQGQGAAEPGTTSAVLEWTSPQAFSWSASAISLKLAREEAVLVDASLEKSTYIKGTDTTATLSASLTDEWGDPITGLSSSNFATTLNGSSTSANFVETSTPGTYRATVNIASLNDGNHSIGITATDARSVVGNDTVNFAVVLPTVLVQSIAYTTSGGKNNDRHITVTITVKNANGVVVPNAAVNYTIRRNGSTVITQNGTTNSTGVVSYTISNAASGCYDTTVNTLTATGYTWNGNTPTNSFCKP